MASAFNANGAQDLFALTPQGQVRHQEGNPGGTWGPWVQFGVLDGTARAITVAADNNKLLHVMVVMADGSVQERSEQAADHWGSWQLFAPAGTAKVLALSQDHQGDLEVFAVTPDQKLITQTQLTPDSSDWGSWESAGTPGVVQSVAATKKIDGYLDVMAVMTNGSVEWEDENRVGWNPWVMLGPAGTAVEVSIGQMANGLEDVFALTSGGTISIDHQQSKSLFGSNWETGLGPSCTAASINVAAQYRQTLLATAICDDGAMHGEWQDVPNGPWKGAWKAIATGFAAMS